MNDQIQMEVFLPSGVPDRIDGPALHLPAGIIELIPAEIGLRLLAASEIVFEVEGFLAAGQNPAFEPWIFDS